MCIISVVVELLQEIVELLQNFRFIYKNFFNTIMWFIFGSSLNTESQNIND